MPKATSLDPGKKFLGFNSALHRFHLLRSFDREADQMHDDGLGGCCPLYYDDTDLGRLVPKSHKVSKRHLF